MIELPTIIPDVQSLLALEPEELGGKMLFLMRNRQQGGQPWLTGASGQFLFSNLETEMWEQMGPLSPSTKYPPQHRKEVALALTEAWAWLEAQGLLVPVPDRNGSTGWRVLSRRAKRMQTEAEFANYKVARLLPKEILHPKIADVVWGAFMRGEYDGAAFHAMKAVEVATRQAAELGDDLTGVKLIRKAFAPSDGPLTDSTMEAGEQEGRMHFFAGAIASYKNPQSHRDVNLDDPLEALEIIYLANHLLRIIDAREKALKKKTA